MNSPVASANSKYAVIEIVSAEPRRECIVIAYADEKLLCDLIALRSIVALGFASRDSADACIGKSDYQTPG
jgi:hypothetical protein